MIMNNNMDNTLVEKFIEFISKYNTVTKENFAGNEIVKILTMEIPQVIKEKLSIDSERFIFKGSCGIGQPSKTPWISIFNKSITQTAQKGVYISFLIKEDMSGMYLLLNQGFTYFKNKYGAKEGKTKIKKASHKIRNILKTLPKDSLENIDLNCSHRSSKGYEARSIGAKYYDINYMPSDKHLIRDIIDYMISYDELKGIIGERTIEQFYDYMLVKEDGYVINDEEEKCAIEDILVNENNAKYNLHEFKGEKKEKKECVVDDEGRKVYLRDPKVAVNAIKRAEYKCEVYAKHTSFIRKKDSKNYTESHHLIPMSFQDEFEYSLDVEENVISLCSTCHNCLHYGIDTERNRLLEKLYNQRKEFLKNVGLEITFEELKRYYKITI